jgi:hypothetical protein
VFGRPKKKGALFWVTFLVRAGLNSFLFICCGVLGATSFALSQEKTSAWGNAQKDRPGEGQGAREIPDGEPFPVASFEPLKLGGAQRSLAATSYLP